MFVEIETKYNIGDKIFVVQDVDDEKHITQIEITEIQLVLYDDRHVINYIYNYGKYFNLVNENDIFDNLDDAKQFILDNTIIEYLDTDK